MQALFSVCQKIFSIYAIVCKKKFLQGFEKSIKFEEFSINQILQPKYLLNFNPSQLTTPPPMKLQKLLPAVVVSLGLAVASSQAQIWDRGAATNNWGDADNWDPNGVPADGSNVTFGATGPGTVSLGSNRTVGDFTVSGAPGSAYTFTGTAGNQLSWSGTLLNSSTQNLTLRHELALVGTGGMRIERTINLGEFGSLNDRNNTFSGGVVLVNQMNLNVQYSSIGTGSSVKDIVGTGNLQFGDGTLNGTGGRLGFNQAGSANATYKNNFVNNVQRDNQGFNGTLTIAHQGGIGAEVATYSRFTGNFTTTALTGGLIPMDGPM